MRWSKCCNMLHMGQHSSETATGTKCHCLYANGHGMISLCDLYILREICWFLVVFEAQFEMLVIPIKLYAIWVQGIWNLSLHYKCLPGHWSPIFGDRTSREGTPDLAILWLWNSLPLEVLQAPTLQAFDRDLKTALFTIFYVSLFYGIFDEFLMVNVIFLKNNCFSASVFWCKPHKLPLWHRNTLNKL